MNTAFKKQEHKSIEYACFLFQLAVPDRQYLRHDMVQIMVSGLTYSMELSYTMYNHVHLNFLRPQQFLPGS
jgi:hypothetical protein